MFYTLFLNAIWLLLANSQRQAQNLHVGMQKDLASYFVLFIWKVKLLQLPELQHCAKELQGSNKLLVFHHDSDQSISWSQAHQMKTLMFGKAFTHVLWHATTSANSSFP